MRTYDLRTRIRIQHEVTTGSGINKTTSGVDLGSSTDTDPPKYIWCDWYPFMGSETWVANSVQVSDGANVVIRFRKDVNSRCRVVKDGIIYQIIAPNDPDQHRQWLKFKVKASVNSG